MIAARDSLIEDLSSRYEQMREDFKYNLDLIEHRDSEIARLNRLRKADKKELEDKEAEIKSLSHRLNSFERQDYELKEAMNLERAHFKVRGLCLIQLCDSLLTSCFYVVETSY
jgi:chromosome segregation ATPase